ncbi:hypothetical protein V7x_00690 [Crateriforma conspicua]|uniref:Uncharacterized protein n=1 Tax=Crateriforma conspicua TaxID=2527996 RepID=A0A5C6FSL8_9PLAN|nr:hypothetical protein [Crateriforma conspicua]TWU64525.1 hypothetical protein V7x_00690 [Crateriforma conspicua]
MTEKQNTPEAAEISKEDSQAKAESTGANDKAEQERLQKLYLEQQRRLACPGCGESPFLG